MAHREGFFPNKTKISKDMKKIIFATVFVFAALSASAQNQEVRQIAKASDVKDYKMAYQEAFNGRANDEVVVWVNDSPYWRGRTIHGWHGTLRGGYGADFGGGLQVYQPQASVVVGYAGGIIDFDASAGFNRLADVEGKPYFAWNAFLEPKWNFCHWGKNGLKTNKLFVGPKIGLQESRDMNTTFYEDEYITIRGNGNDRSMGLAYGLTLGYEHRFFMNPNRLGIMLDVHTYDTQKSFKFTMNGEVLKNEISKTQRLYVGVSVYYKFVFQKKAQNF